MIATNKTGISYTTENISTGPSVDILSTIEGNESRLAIIAKVTEFLGYDQPTPGQEAQAAPPGGKPLKGTIPLPRLRVRSVEADARIQFGDTMALRGVRRNVPSPALPFRVRFLLFPGPSQTMTWTSSGRRACWAAPGSKVIKRPLFFLASSIR